MIINVPMIVQKTLVSQLKEIEFRFLRKAVRVKLFPLRFSLKIFWVLGKDSAENHKKSMERET